MSLRLSLGFLFGTVAAGSVALLTWRWYEEKSQSKERPSCGKSDKETLMDESNMPLGNSKMQRKKVVTEEEAVRVIQSVIMARTCLQKVVGKALRRKKNREGLEKEIVEAEGKYVANLKILQSKFKKPVEELFRSKKRWNKEDFVKMFNNLDSIVALHCEIEEELRDGERNGWLQHLGPASVLHKYSHYFRLYAEYLIHYDHAVDLINQYKTNHKSFRALLEKCRWEVPAGAPRGTRPRRIYQEITSYLIMPCQRIPRYELLLSGLKKYTWQALDPVGYELISEAHNRAREAAQQNEMTQKISLDFAHLRDLQDRILGLPVPIFESSRQLLHEGKLNLKIPPRAGGFEPAAPSRGATTSSEIAAALHKGYNITCIVYLFTDLVVWTDKDNQWRGAGSLEDAVVEEFSSSEFVVQFEKFWQRPPASKKLPWSPFQSRHKSRSSRFGSASSFGSNRGLAPGGHGVGGRTPGANDVCIRVQAQSENDAAEWVSRLRGAVFDLETKITSRKNAVASVGSPSSGSIGFGSPRSTADSRAS